MTNQERLEKIKEDVKGHEAELPNVMWLIKQAERKQELEEQKLALIEEMGQVDERFLDLEQQNKKLREALEEIKNHEISQCIENGQWTLNKVGKIAKEALEKSK